MLLQPEWASYLTIPTRWIKTALFCSLTWVVVILDIILVSMMVMVKMDAMQVTSLSKDYPNLLLSMLEKQYPQVINIINSLHQAPNTSSYFTDLLYNAMMNSIIPTSMFNWGKCSILMSYSLIYSGSTVCTVIFNGTKVYCANAGDSRAIKVAFPK